MESVIQIEIVLPKKNLRELRLQIESAFTHLHDRLPDGCIVTVKGCNRGTLGELLAEQE